MRVRGSRACGPEENWSPSAAAAATTRNVDAPFGSQILLCLSEAPVRDAGDVPLCRSLELPCGCWRRQRQGRWSRQPAVEVRRTQSNSAGRKAGGLVSPQSVLCTASQREGKDSTDDEKTLAMAGESVSQRRGGGRQQRSVSEKKCRSLVACVLINVHFSGWQRVPLGPDSAAIHY